MVVEDEPRTIPTTHPAGDGPKDVWRVARLHHLKFALTTSTENQRRGREERVDILDDKAERPSPRCVRTVLQQRDALDNLVAGIVLSFRADDRDVVPCRRQGLAFQPDPTVEGDRQVLDDDENAWLGTQLIRAGHTAHPIPSYPGSRSISGPRRPCRSRINAGGVVRNSSMTA